MLNRRPIILRLAFAVLFAGIAAQPGCAGGEQGANETDARQIVERAAQALNADWAADPSWASVEREETRKGDKSTSRTFEDLMIDGSDYDFPLAVNDQPLTPDRRKAQLIKLRDECERRRNESPSERESRIAKWKKQRDENGELLLDFPGALDFVLTGEEIKNGRPAYVFHGTPKPGMVAKTRAQKVLAGIQGTAWVDRETLHPVAVDCTVIKPVPIYGVLASVLPGTKIEIEMTRVAESVWLIDKVSFSLNLSRLGLFKSSSATLSTYTSYRPNDAELTSLLAEANRE